jgi:hypothetical protein
MKLFILMVIMTVDDRRLGGAMVAFQEFNGLEQCKYAASLILKNDNAELAQCVVK